MLRMFYDNKNKLSSCVCFTACRECVAHTPGLPTRCVVHHFERHVVMRVPVGSAPRMKAREALQLQAMPFRPRS